MLAVPQAPLSPAARAVLHHIETGELRLDIASSSALRGQRLGILPAVHCAVVAPAPLFQPMLLSRGKLPVGRDWVFEPTEALSERSTGPRPSVEGPVHSRALPSYPVLGG